MGKRTDSNFQVLLCIRAIKLTIGEVTMLSFLVCPRLVPVLKQQHLALFYKINFK